MRSPSSQNSPEHARSVQFKKQKTQLELPVEHLAVPVEEAQRVRSVQNVSSKKFVFPTPEVCREILETERRLARLEAEKQLLLEELRKMREGALSAIMEKEEAIERLHEKIEEAKGEAQQDRDGYFTSVQLQEAQCELERLEREREQLRDEHIEAIIKKDRMVDDLAEELQKVRNSVTTLELEDRALTEKLSRLELENYELHDELLRSRTSLVELRNSMVGSDSVAFSCSLGRSIFSSPGFRPPPSELRSERKCSDSSDLSAVMRLKEANAEMRGRHQQELEHLRRYYAALLEEIERGFGRGFTVPSEENLPTESNLPTDQNESLPEEKCDLKNEIRLLEQDSVSAVENPEKRVPTCPDETESQFSLKHFQYDAREREKELALKARLEAVREAYNRELKELTSRNESVTSKVSAGSQASCRRKGRQHQQEARTRLYWQVGGGLAVSIGLLYLVFIKKARN